MFPHLFRVLPNFHECFYLTNRFHFSARVEYLTRSLRSLVKCFRHSKRNYVSPRAHVITCYLHGWRYHVFARKLSWYFIGVYINKLRILHGRAEIQTYSSSDDSKFEWGPTLLWSFCTQLFHQGSTLVLELGPHKDREKLWPGWDLNPRPHPGQSFSLSLCGPNPNTRVDPWSNNWVQKLHSSVRPHSNLECSKCYWRTTTSDYSSSVGQYIKSEHSEHVRPSNVLWFIM